MATIPEPQPGPPEIPIPNPDDHPAREEPIEPEMVPPRTDPLPPETVNRSQDDEASQSQTLASSSGGDADFALEDSEKVAASDEADDVQDLVDHMHDMVHSGRIDMDAYRGERSDEDEEGMFGASGDDD